MTPDLSRRLGRALGTKYTTLPEQEMVRQAAADAEVWADLSDEAQRLVESIEARPDPWTHGDVDVSDAESGVT